MFIYSYVHFSVEKINKSVVCSCTCLCVNVVLFVNILFLSIDSSFLNFTTLYTTTICFGLQLNNQLSILFNYLDFSNLLNLSTSLFLETRVLLLYVRASYHLSFVDGFTPFLGGGGVCGICVMSVNLLI